MPRSNSRDSGSTRLEQEMKYREIAALLKISVGTVKAHLSQARKRLTEELGESFDMGDLE